MTEDLKRTETKLNYRLQTNEKTLLQRHQLEEHNVFPNSACYQS